MALNTNLLKFAAIAGSAAALVGVSAVVNASTAVQPSVDRGFGVAEQEERPGNDRRVRRGQRGPNGFAQGFARRGGHAGGPKVLMPRLDDNGDGVFSAQELDIALDQGLERAQDRALRAFDVIDANGDGAVTKDEVSAFVLDRHEKRVSMARERFDRADANADGVIAEDERTARRAAAREKIAEIRAEFDADGDGRLSPDERRTAGEALRARRALDLTRDGSIDERDITEALRLAGQDELPDVNRDGVKDANDLQALIDGVRERSAQ